MRSVDGLGIAQRIACAAVHKLQLTASGQRFPFGVTSNGSLGSFKILIPTPGGATRVCPDVVKADVTFLLGLYELDRSRVQALTVQDLAQLISRPGAAALPWSMPYSRNLDHVFLPLTPVSPTARIFYKRSQLAKLHRSLYNPSTAKIYELLKLADPSQLDADTRKVVEEIIWSCAACQRYTPAPISLMVSLPCHVNRQLRTDLCFFRDRDAKLLPLPQVVDTATHLQVAAFLQGEDSESVWVVFLMCWARLFVGDPEEIPTDSDSCFTSPHFTKLCAANLIRLRHTGVESHNSFGEGETYHRGLRKIFKKMRMKSPTTRKVILLQFTVFAFHRSVNVHELTHMPLVQGMLPQRPGIAGTGSLTQDQRIWMPHAAREEFSMFIAQRCAALGLKKKLPSVADAIYEVEDMVYLWRKDAKLWTGSWKINKAKEKNVWITVDSKGSKAFSVTKCKKAFYLLLSTGRNSSSPPTRARRRTPCLPLNATRWLTSSSGEPSS